MWWFYVVTVSQEEIQFHCLTWFNAIEWRQRLTQEKAFRGTEPNDVWYTSAVRCTDCGGYFKPDGPEGPDCMCIGAPTTVLERSGNA